MSTPYYIKDKLRVCLHPIDAASYISVLSASPLAHCFHPCPGYNTQSSPAWAARMAS